MKMWMERCKVSNQASGSSFDRRRGQLGQWRRSTLRSQSTAAAAPLPLRRRSTTTVSQRCSRSTAPWKPWRRELLRRS